MAEYPSIVLTNAGLDMIAESQAGQNLIFTKLKIGDGLLGEGESISALTALKSPKLDIPIQGFLNQGNGQVRLRFLVDNSGVPANQGFFMREVGIYAKIGESGTEKLYAYTNGGNKVDWIPDKNTPIDAQIFDIFVLIGNASNVTVVIDGSVTYATVDDLNAHKTTTPLDHPDGSVTDAKIGNRTITDTTAATAGPGALTNLLSKLGYMIKNITGKSNWYTLPAVTLEAINNLIVSTASAGKLLKLDANGKLPADITGNAATATNATNHIAATTGAHAATAISCTATGNISATNVQDAIEELSNKPSGLNLWKPSQTYTIGDIAYSPTLPSYAYLECIQAGTTGSTEPIWPAVGDNVTDGTVEWVVRDIREVEVNKVMIAESTGYGVIKGLSVSAQNPPDMTVKVEGGTAHMPSGKRAVIATIKALAILSADPLLPRIDRIYVNSSGQVAYAQGTPAASPVAPALPSGSVKGYRVNVAAGVTSITNADLVDERETKLIEDNDITKNRPKMDVFAYLNQNYFTAGDTTSLAGQGIAVNESANELLISFSRQDNTNAVIQVYDLTTKEFKRQYTNLPYGHCSSLAYNPNTDTILIPKWDKDNSDYSLLKVKYSDMSLISSHSLGQKPALTAYFDNKYIIMDVENDGLTDDIKVYITDQQLNILHSFYIHRPDYVLNGHLQNWIQGIAVSDNSLVVSWTEVITVNSLSTGKKLREFIYPKATINYPNEEFEGMCVLGEDILLLTNQWGYTPPRYHIYKFNIKSNGNHTHLINDLQFVQQGTTLEVNKNYNGGTGDGTKTKPFTSILQALKTLNPLLIGDVTINVAPGDYSDEGGGLLLLKYYNRGFIRFVGASNKADAVNYKLPSLQLQGVHRVEFVGFNFNRPISSADVLARETNATFKYCIFDSINSGVKKNNIINAITSNIYLIDCDYSNAWAALYAIENASIYVSGSNNTGTNNTYDYAAISGNIFVQNNGFGANNIYLGSSMDTVGEVRFSKRTAAPTSGTWTKGCVIYNSAPAAGNYIGWICVTSGTPGTWKGFGLIQA